MTRIKSFKCVVPEADGTGQYKTVFVNYESKGDRFYVNIPTFMDTTASPGLSSSINNAKATVTRTIGDGRIYGVTPGDVQELFERRCHDYIKGCRQARHVLVYVLNYALSGSREHHGMPFDKGTGLSIQWEEGWEIKIGTQDAVYWHHNPITNPNICNNTGLSLAGRRGTGTIIDWTDSRRDFFVALDEKLKTMIERSRAFLEDGEKLGLMIDSGKGLLALGFDSKK